MYITPIKDDITTEEIVQELMKNGFECIKDDKRNLYILYNKHFLLYNTNNFSEDVSINKLRTWYQGNPKEKIEGSNCTNEDALKRIDILEKIVKYIINSSNKDDIFNYLPYTKTNKFSKSGAINLFIPNIKSTYSGDYFSQTEIALQLRPLEIMPSKGFSFSGVKFNEICTLEINPRASFINKKTPENIIDENCNFQIINTSLRNKYLKQQDLVPGCSYIDAKGSEYLYIGIASYHTCCEYMDNNNNISRNNYSGKNIKYLYLRVTSNVKKKLLKYTNFSDFLNNRFDEVLKKELFDWDKGLNITESKKFVSLDTIYFDSQHNKTNDAFVYQKPKGSIKEYPDMSMDINIKIN